MVQTLPALGIAAALALLPGGAALACGAPAQSGPSLCCAPLLQLLSRGRSEHLRYGRDRPPL